jgi:hypothetical protein
MPAKTTRYLTAAEILDAEDRKPEPVDVPEWGGTVLVWPLTGTDRDRYQGGSVAYRQGPNGTLMMDRVITENSHARLVAMSVGDETGARLFTDAQVIALGKKNGAALDRIFDVASRISRLTPAEIDIAKEALGKDQSDAAGSDSPDSSE